MSLSHSLVGKWEGMEIMRPDQPVPYKAESAMILLSAGMIKCKTVTSPI